MKKGLPREWTREKLPETIKENARVLRKNSTGAEKILWEMLRNRKLDGYKFRRQQPLEGFILDFYCDELKLGIELDGDYHLSDEQKNYDRLRSEYLEEFGITIIRFSNEEVIKDLEGVTKNIRQKAKVMPGENPSPLPLSPGRGVSAGRGEGKFFRFQSLLQKSGWLSPAYVGINGEGIIQYLDSKPPVESVATESVLGLALPGFQNAHSHAFQYAMAGLAENHPAGTSDDFWTWREAMYQCALAVDPDQAEAIAAMVYAEMLRNGYTHVAEFHYLHHDKDGKPYSNLAEMGERMVRAAKTAGIKITLVPVFYQKSNFETDPLPRQRRFISKSVDDYSRLLEASGMVVRNAGVNLAFSVHSMRAVESNDILTTLSNAPGHLPFHIHVAEQKKEVTDCLAALKKRPMQWMLENLEVNERFHLVHSTHLDDDEIKKLAATGAHVVLCPSTEGNLGDGIFRMKEYVKLGGHWSIGTDSHIGLNPLEEYRMIDYRQRLLTHQRNTFDGNAAHYMLNESISSGRKSMGENFNDHFELGKPLDAVVYNATSHLLAETAEVNRLATLLYTSDSSRTIGTLVNGKWVVKSQHHVNGHRIKENFTQAMRQLKNR